MSSHPPWRSLIEQAAKSSPLAKEFSLATSSPEGPHNRTVTFQGFSPSGLFIVATDRSSVKVSDIRSCPAVEIGWFIPSDASQYRIRGHGVVIGEPHEFRGSVQRLGLPTSARETEYTYWASERARIWTAMGPKTAKFDHVPSANERKPPMEDNAHFNFVLIAIVPTWVQQLDLVKMGYTSWSKESGEWAVEPRPVVMVDRAQL